MSEREQREGIPQSGEAGEEALPYDEDLLEDAREDALDFLEGLLDSMDVDGEVSAEIEPDGTIAAFIEGSDGGLLIGSRGQTLDAIQELLRAAVQAQAQARIRVTLDIEGYRERRREAVRKHAEAMAERAAEEGEAELEPMPAFERKIVHETVAGIDGVTSYSEGQEPRRRVLIRREA
ncbi:MAG: KH domain-containing protein [Actinomycetota bacterium]|nr:KH domain-containing protein [Actinomycetota bacterium]